MTEIRAFAVTQRAMQRLGYLKRLIRRVTTLSSSSLDNLGNDLIETVARKIRVPLDDARVEYIKLRLYDRAYTTLKAQSDEWQNGDKAGSPPIVGLEMQDLYLADKSLPSQGGKLVKADWNSYPPLGVGLGLIRSGTYSANTRALSFLHFVSDEENQAFLEYLPDANPFRISRQQGLLLLYSFLENDGEVVAPLFRKILQDYPTGFSDRNAGDLLPEVYHSIATRHRARALSADARDRLASLEKTAESIARRREIERYVGSSREHASRVRVEPYVDIGLFGKSDPFKFEYTISSAGHDWIDALEGVETSDQIEEFLMTQFFTTASKALEIGAISSIEPECIVPYLYRAWEKIQSPGGYCPIEELALVGGIKALLEHNLIMEIGAARDAIIAYQKANPYLVRFTVNRMGVLAHARFVEPPSSPLLDKCQ